jgi:hypothetical protein
VHIRRKGFIDYPDFHGVLALDYYYTAIEHIRAKTGPTRFYVFADADDRSWCRENFPNCSVVEGTNKYEDIQLMASCKHAITANSSFSFWGAWLGDNKPDRIVIAPTKMFTDPSLADDADMFPKRWRRM